MKKVEKLTKTQEAALAQYRDKWISIGLSVEETDIEKAESAIDKVYTSAGLPTPEEKVWARNPYEGVILAAQLEKYGKIRAADPLEKTEITNQLSKAGYGNHDASWLSFYDFFQKETKIDLHQIDGLIALSSHCGWWWAFENTVIMVPKPTRLCLDAEGTLHCENGPALSYSDGWSIYCWHGIRIPEKLIKNPESYTAEDVLNENNVEVRRCMIEKLGVDFFAKNATFVCKDEVGELFRLEIKDDEDILFTHVINSSPEPDGNYKSYYLRVPTHVETPKEGIAWTFQKEEKDYAPIKET